MLSGCHAMIVASSASFFFFCLCVFVVTLTSFFNLIRWSLGINQFSHLRSPVYTHTDTHTSKASWWLKKCLLNRMWQRAHSLRLFPSPPTMTVVTSSSYSPAFSFPCCASSLLFSTTSPSSSLCTRWASRQPRSAPRSPPPHI